MLEPSNQLNLSKVHFGSLLLFVPRYEDALRTVEAADHFIRNLDRGRPFCLPQSLVHAGCRIALKSLYDHYQKIGKNLNYSFQRFINACLPDERALLDQSTPCFDTTCINLNVTLQRRKMVRRKYPHMKNCPNTVLQNYLKLFLLAYLRPGWYRGAWEGVKACGQPTVDSVMIWTFLKLLWWLEWCLKRDIANHRALAKSGY